MFLESLLEAYHTYTPIDPEASEDKHILNIRLVSKLATDITKKIRRTLSEFMEVAQKVFNNKDSWDSNILKIPSPKTKCQLRKFLVL